MRHRRHGYHQPLLDPLDEVDRQSPLTASGGAAYVDVADGDRVRVAGFTRPLDFPTDDSYVGRHRKADR